MELICEKIVVRVNAFGKDIILIETVGVGQDEIDIAKAADLVMVVCIPGQGDGIQALKASKYFKLKMIKRKFGFRQRCGIGEWALRYYVEQAIQYGQPVAVINQTGYVAGNIAERKLSVQYKPLKRCFFLD